ncbi:MAG: FAD-dependent thymidylate synthase [Bacilli bacterium]|nr:FAD-dependent thymidylate synthase [Bacilli bacterium]
MIKIIRATPNPLTLMGIVASTCWNSTPSPQIGINCIESGHGRVLEYPDVIVEIDGYSARMIRELYTKIVGVTRLQASTRYIQYGEFEYYIPESVKNNNKALDIYENLMQHISTAYLQLEELGIPKQDTANVLPLAMHSKVVLKINARGIIEMALTRLCNRALKEYRDFMIELINVIGNIDGEWKKIVSYAKPKCEVYGYCNEKNSCKGDDN